MRNVQTCELGEEADVVRELAEAQGYPIVVVTEHPNTNFYPDFETAPDFYGEYFFDTKKLIEDPDCWRDMGCVRYVAFILESALKGVKSTTASRKYSFGDTQDWWDVFGPGEDTEDRIVLQIDVGINY